MLHPDGDYTALEAKVLDVALILHADHGLSLIHISAGPASYGMTDTMGRMHSDAQFAGSSSVPAHVEMMGLIGAGNNPMVDVYKRQVICMTLPRL